MKKNTCPESGSLITSCSINTPIGSYKVETCDIGLHRLGMGHIKDGDFLPDISIKVEVDADVANEKSSLPKPISQVVEWLGAYFQDPVMLNDIGTTPTLCFPLDRTTEFERSVWNTLAATALFGKKLSYGQLADEVGNPKASRAVGTAMKKNPIALIIPCHRVIRSNGSIGNYAGGAIVKDWLINHESRQSKQNSFAAP